MSLTWYSWENNTLLQEVKNTVVSSSFAPVGPKGDTQRKNENSIYSTNILIEVYLRQVLKHSFHPYDALFAESSIDAFKEMCILHNISIKIAFVSFKATQHAA